MREATTKREARSKKKALLSSPHLPRSFLRRDTTESPRRTLPNQNIVAWSFGTWRERLGSGFFFFARFRSSSSKKKMRTLSYFDLTFFSIVFPPLGLSTALSPSLSALLQLMLHLPTALCRLQAAAPPVPRGLTSKGGIELVSSSSSFIVARPRPQQRSRSLSRLAAAAGDPKEWTPPDEGGVFPSQRPPSELDLGRRSLESEALPERPPLEFSPPEPAPTPRVLPEKGPEEEEREEAGTSPAPPPSEPEEFPRWEPEVDPAPSEEEEAEK